MYAQAARKYRQVDVDSAPKTLILDKLFIRCVRDIDDAVAAIESCDVQARASAIDHAFRIITELQAALDAEAAPELAASLSGLYDFVLELLSAANAADDEAALAHARAIVEHVGDSFRLAASNQSAG